jgi:hypothetical protein
MDRDEIGGANSTSRRDENSYDISVGKHEEMWS